MADRFKAKGLVVIGQNVFDQDEVKVEAFIAKIGAKMAYRVALDSKGAMAESWLQAAAKTGIPPAFLIGKDGRIAWMGHPLEKPAKQIGFWAGQHEIRELSPAFGSAGLGKGAGFFADA